MMRLQSDYKSVNTVS